MRLLRHKLWAVPAAAFACLVLLSAPVWAGNGKIAGTVKDDAGQALAGANVIATAPGQQFGATTDAQGRYFILNLPPGAYSVQATYVAHKPVQRDGVRVALDLTTQEDFTLVAEAVQTAPVTVVAKRPMVEKSLTTSQASIASEQLNNTMPVADVQELVNTAPGVFRGYIRGGRKAEAKVLIDGIDVSDTYFRAGEGAETTNGYVDANRSGSGEFSAVGINASNVRALDVVAGTFNAEYDAASAGLINMVTKDGGDKVQGKVFLRRGLGGAKNAGPDVYSALVNPTPNATTGVVDTTTYYGRYLRERATLAASTDAANQAKAAQYYTFDPDNVTYGDNPATETEVSIGGPLPVPRTNFYLTARYSNDEGQLPNQLERSVRTSLKLTHQVTDAVKLTGNVMVDDGGELGDWTNRSFSGKFAYYPVGAMGNRKLGTMAYLGLTHVLSPSTFYEVKVSNVTRSSEFGYSDDDGDGKVEAGEDGDFIFIDSRAESEKYLGVKGSGAAADGSFTFFTTNPGNSKNFDLPFGDNQYRLAQPGFYYEDLHRDVRQVKGDFTSQLNFNHQIKTGFLYRQHDISKLMQRTQVTVTYADTLPYEISQYDKAPTEKALYVQDRIEYGGMIVNAGLRLDGLNVDAKQVANFFQPSVDTVYTYANGTTQKYRTPVRSGKAIATKWFWQPRIGISHPISDKAAMHYSWGKFYSPPSFSTLYEDYNSFTNPSWPTLYDADADPTTATAYEMGLQYSFHPDYVLGLTAYYRDIENYGRIGFTVTPKLAGFATYTINTSGGYADSRGFEVTLERRAVGRLSGRLSYGYSYIKSSASGNNSTPFPDQSTFSVNSTKDVTQLPIAMDQREIANTYETNVSGGGNPLLTGYDRTHRLGVTLIAKLPAAAELSLITTAESGFVYPITATTADLRERQTDRAPWNLRTDARLGRDFTYGGRSVGAFLEARNLFNRSNILTFDNRNVASVTKWETSQDPTGDLNRAFTGQSQPIYDIPRLVSLGITLDF